MIGKPRNLAAESRLVGDVRGRGLMVLPCGTNSIRFSPPLTVTEREANTAFEIFANALIEIGTRSLWTCGHYDVDVFDHQDCLPSPSKETQ